jgi:hypothetical protein
VGQTRSVVHLTFFPVAIGLFYATFSWNRTKNFRPGGWLTAVVLLLCLLFVAGWLVVKDFTGGFAGPHELNKNQDQEEALRIEKKLRGFVEGHTQDTAADNVFKYFNIKRLFEEWKIGRLKKEYKDLIAGQNSEAGFRSKWDRINWIGRIGFVLNMLFGLFDAIFFWWLVVAVLAVASEELEQNRLRLSKSLSHKPPSPLYSGEGGGGGGPRILGKPTPSPQPLSP